jgi:hypothetical protein
MELVFVFVINCQRIEIKIMISRRKDFVTTGCEHMTHKHPVKY